MMHWWENLLPREKMAFATGALAVALLLLYLLFLQPWLSRQSRLRKEVSDHRAELTWMREAAKEIAQSSPPAPEGSATVPPLQLIDQAARENHLSEQLKRMEPGSNGEIKVWLNNAVFVDLLRWLRQLSGTGRLSITNLNLEKGSAPGLVNAQLTLNSTGGQ